jgi:hypothetical protein
MKITCPYCKQDDPMALNHPEKYACRNCDLVFYVSEVDIAEKKERHYKYLLAFWMFSTGRSEIKKAELEEILDMITE